MKLKGKLYCFSTRDWFRCRLDTHKAHCHNVSTEWNGKVRIDWNSCTLDGEEQNEDNPQ